MKQRNVARRRLFAAAPGTRALAAALGAAIISTACADREGEPGHVDLYADLGDHHLEIATDAEAAQRYFDQGLRLQYGFNHAEAIRAYEEAIRYDPSCAMCWWGIALASGPNINAEMEPESGRRAYAAIRKARELSAGGPPKEVALIEALASRYGPDGDAGRSALDSAYAGAMATVAEEYPGDADVLALYAASLMNLSPWDYWTPELEPRAGTDEILTALAQALESDPDNPGACHYFIHAVEVAHPERAVACADRLAALMPGAGHIVHMPGHIYIRVGRYADAVRANEHAVHADEGYIADQRPAGLYPTAYYPHNYHFMAFAAIMAGMSDKAVSAARKVAPKVPPEVAAQIHWIQNVVVFPSLTLLTFGRWDDVLDEPMPPSNLATATAMAHYARGTAFAATGRRAEAGSALAEIQRIATQEGTRDAEGGALDAGRRLNAVIAIAQHALAGEIALRSGQQKEAVAHFEAAAEIEDGMIYEEPPLWYYPIRHSLGRALLEADRPADAEQAYREDLERFPDNGWSLYGLAASLRAQGQEAEAEEVEDRFQAAWMEADVRITASRF